MNDSPLFASARLGAIEIPNRVLMAPLTRSRADAMGVPAHFAATYYAQRASAGLVITEATQVSFEGMGYPRTPGAHTEAQLARWKEVASAVHRAGGKIVMQLWHVGRVANALNRGVSAETVSASAVRAPGQMYTDAAGMRDHDMPRPLETNEIARIADDFAAAAESAIRIGFDGVEFHSANGYLAHQFLSTNVNQRTDRYGGSVANRIRMPLEVLEAIVARVPAERVGVRISPGNAFNGIEETDMADLYGAYIKTLDGFGLAYLHVIRMTQDRDAPNAADEEKIRMARAVFRGPVIANGAFNKIGALEAIGRQGVDAIAFGRPFIANPDLPRRFGTGARLAEPNPETFYTPGEAGYTDYPALAA